MTNPQIADVFRRLANLMELRQDNAFKIRAYRNAADVIEDTPTPLVDMISAGGVSRLRELPGVGEAISKKIEDLLTTGSFKAYDEIRREIPETVLDLLQVDGVGVKMLQLLFSQFQLTNLEDFAKFAAGGGLNSVPLIGEKGQQRILKSLREMGYKEV